MKQKRLGLYTIDLKYVRDLAKVDDNVMSISPQIAKNTRPFVGTIVVCADKKYCIPLSSPKPKHYNMKNDIDFMKIYNGEKLVGVLNFNNMIPVDDAVIYPLDMRISNKDNAITRRYKIMCAKQLTWCQRNQEIIIIKANKLYNMIVSDKASYQMRKRCCDFLKLEQILEKRK